MLRMPVAAPSRMARSAVLRFMAASGEVSEPVRSLPAYPRDKRPAGQIGAAARPGAVWLVDREGGRPDAVPLETGADRAGRAPGLGRRSMPAGAGYTPRSTPWGVGEDTAERTPAGGPLA